MNVRSFIALIILCLVAYTGKANNQSDSLLLALKQAKHDTTKIRINNELSELFTKTNPDTAYHYVNEAIRLSELYEESSDDELVKVVKRHQLNSYTLLGHYYKALSKYDEAVESYQNSLSISRELEDFPGEANSFINIGIIKTNKGDYLIAINYFKNAVEIFEKINDEVGLAKVYRNIGNVYYYEGQYDLALESYQKSLELCEKLNDLSSVSRCQGNIGMIHKEMGHYDWSIDYFEKSLFIKKEIGDKRGEANIFNGLGEVYFLKKESKKALEYHNKALEIRMGVKDTRGAAFSMTNIGKVLFEEDNYHQADSFYKAALKIFEEIQDQERSSEVYNELAKINLEQKDYFEAVRYANISLKIGQEISALPRIKDAYESLYKSYEQQYNINKAFENFKLYFEYYKKFVVIKDSIQSDIAEKLIKNEQQYKIDQKQREIENQELKLKSQEAAEKNLKMQMYLLLLGFAAMIIFAFVLFRNYKQKTKANQLLREQKEALQNAKEEIEAQKTEIEDSIIYAQNIQKAVLPSFDLREQILPEHFIFFRPRNIVSGDFFWVKKLKNFVVVAIADCTGHGVPGAFMSMLGFMFLNEIVTTRSLDNAGQILNKLREKVKKSLHQSGKEGEAKDGMDMSFFIIDTESKELQFSGAFNPLYIIREDNLVNESEIPESEGIKPYKSKDNSIEATLFEIKGDRQPIAIYMYEKEFSNYVFQLKEGDRIYSFTDGYPDQFGGEEGKKFNAKRFKEFLLSIRNHSMEKQKELITENFYSWMGEIEQVDDVLLMGVKID
jgi:serine phosphatase RsbU (regulator of sigma subunit)/Tfp pilus assembly protein PilF